MPGPACPVRRLPRPWGRGLGPAGAARPSTGSMYTFRYSTLWVVIPRRTRGRTRSTWAATPPALSRRRCRRRRQPCRVPRRPCTAPPPTPPSLPLRRRSTPLHLSCRPPPRPRTRCSPAQVRETERCHPRRRFRAPRLCPTVPLSTAWRPWALPRLPCLLALPRPTSTPHRALRPRLHPPSRRTSPWRQRRHRPGPLSLPLPAPALLLRPPTHHPWPEALPSWRWVGAPPVLGRAPARLLAVLPRWETAR